MVKLKQNQSNKHIAGQGLGVIAVEGYPSVFGKGLYPAAPNSPGGSTAVPSDTDLKTAVSVTSNVSNNSFNANNNNNSFSEKNNNNSFFGVKHMQKKGGKSPKHGAQESPFSALRSPAHYDAQKHGKLVIHTSVTPSSPGKGKQKIRVQTPSTAAPSPLNVSPLHPMDSFDLHSDQPASSDQLSSEEVQFIGTVGSFWEEDLSSTGVLDWSRKGVPKIFRQGRWMLTEEVLKQTKEIPIDWSPRKMPQIFAKVGMGYKRQVAQVPTSDLYNFHWSRNGLPKHKFTFWERPLMIDWTGDGAPPVWSQVPKSWEIDLLALDWSSPGIPQQMQHGLWKHLCSKVDGVMALDWSGKGVPKVFRQIQQPRHRNPCDQLETLDWSTPGIPFQFRQGAAKTLEREMDFAVDWSCKGVPLKNSAFAWDLAFDWSTKGVPQMFRAGYRQDCMPKSHDWSIKGLPGKFIALSHPRSMTNNLGNEACTYVDWSGQGVPFGRRKLVENQNYGMVSWLQSGIPSIIRNADWKPKHGTTFVPSPKSQPEKRLFVRDKKPNLTKNSNPYYKQKLGVTAPASQLDTDGVEYDMDPEIVKELAEFNKLIPSSGALDKPHLHILNPPQKYTQEQKQQIYWAKQLDWSVEGIPAAFHKAENRKKHIEKLERPFYKTGEDILTIDWAHTGKNQMPSQYRAMKTWSHARGRKQMFDDLCIDWSENGTVKEFQRDGVPLCRDNQYAEPMVMDWSERGIPQAIRNVWGGRTAALDYIILDWSEAGIPKWLDSVAKCGHRNADWPKMLNVPWHEEGLPTIEFSRGEGLKNKRICFGSTKKKDMEMYEEPVQFDFSGSGMPFKNSLFDELTIDWTQEGDFTSMEATHNVPNNATCPYNLRKNRSWNTKRSYKIVDTYLWEDGRLYAAYSKSVITPKDPSTPVDSHFSRSYKILGEKANQTQQSEEMCYVNWCKKGVDLHKTIHRDREYALDWNSNGIPYTISAARERPRGYNFENVVDWSEAGSPPLPMVWNQKSFERSGTYKPTQNSKFWILMNALPNCVPKLDNAKVGKFYSAVDWSSKGMPRELYELPFEQNLAIDWTPAGIPSDFKEKYAPSIKVDWSSDGLPVVFHLGKRDFDTTCIDWTVKGLPGKFQQACSPKFYNEGPFVTMDWSKKGLPFSFESIWDDQNLVLDWSTKGLPRGGATFKNDRGGSPGNKGGPRLPGKEFNLDWSSAGLPQLLQAVTSFSTSTEESWNLVTKKHASLTPYQKVFADETRDFHNLMVLKPNLKAYNHRAESPVNATRNAIRGAKSNYRMIHSKKTKQRLLVLLRKEAKLATELRREHIKKHRDARRKRALFDKAVYDGRFLNLNDTPESAPLVNDTLSKADVYNKSNENQQYENLGNNTKDCANYGVNMNHQQGQNTDHNMVKRNNSTDNMINRNNSAKSDRTASPKLKAEQAPKKKQRRERQQKNAQQFQHTTGNDWVVL